MSRRRHTSATLAHGSRHAFFVALSIALLVTAVLPLAVAGQSINDRDVDKKWQLLTYLPPDSRELQPVPAGVGAQILLFAGENVRGNAACSTFETLYQRSGANLTFADADPAYVECDPASLEFDDVFYRHLANTASIEIDDSILRLKDSIDRPLMVLTSASIDDDPTVARWDLARIGGADGSVEPIIVGLDPWIEFLSGGRVVGSSACGSFLGSYSTNEGTMDITDLRFRLRDCTSAAEAQARRTIDTLSEVSRFEVLPAGMDLKDENGITRLAMTPDISLGRRIWTPTEILKPNGTELYKSTPGDDADPLATSAVKFSGQAVEGRTRCRPFWGESLRDGLALSVDESTITYAKGSSCPKNKKAAEWVKIESAFVDALKATASHALRGSELELKDVKGRTLMRLEPQVELVGPTWVVTAVGQKRIAPVEGPPYITLTFDDVTDTVFGDTGAANGNGANTYQLFYEPRRATRINIPEIDYGFDVDNIACKTKRQRNSEMCKQEREFLDLMSKVDGYIPHDDKLQLMRGNRVVIRAEPEQVVTAREG